MFHATSLVPESLIGLDSRSLPNHQSGLGNEPRGPLTGRSQLPAEPQLTENLQRNEPLTSILSVERSNFGDDPLSLRSPSQRRVTPLSRKAAAGSVETDRDQLTGLRRDQAIAGTTGRKKMPRSKQVAGTSFSRTYGYGLVNAAKAVAWSLGYYPKTLPEVGDWGSYNWGLDRVKAQEAWNWGVTGNGVTVAVIDSGVDINHPDLVNNIWRNTNEIAGDGIDNDGNGYVDDVYGWNFASNQYNNNVLPRSTAPQESHGTHVAGTIAAGWNGFGTTGVAPNAKIMALRLGDVGADGRFSNSGRLADAIYYAVNNGARVINLSLSGSDSPALKQALAYAARRNVIVVSAAGNSSESRPRTPARYATQYGISVGATDYYNRITYFSNRAGSDSRLQHVVAPGDNLWSTVPTNDYDGQSYGQKSGTSMAAPHVAGVVALMLSANPSLTHAQVRYILTASASSYSSSIRQNQHSHQRLSMKAASIATAEDAPIAPSLLSIASVQSPSLELSSPMDLSIPQPGLVSDQPAIAALSLSDRTLDDRFDRPMPFQDEQPISVNSNEGDDLLAPGLKFKYHRS